MTLGPLLTAQRYCTMGQARAYTGRSRNTLKRYIAQGMIKAVRVGPRGDWSIDVESLDRLFGGKSKQEIKAKALDILRGVKHG